jgi:hypothetical protein
MGLSENGVYPCVPPPNGTFLEVPYQTNSHIYIYMYINCWLVYVNNHEVTRYTSGIHFNDIIVGDSRSLT